MTNGCKQKSFALEHLPRASLCAKQHGEAKVFAFNIFSYTFVEEIFVYSMGRS